MAWARHVVEVDPIEFKREKAMEFGATTTFASMEETLLAVMELTEGLMADKLIMTPGVMYGDLMVLGARNSRAMEAPSWSPASRRSPGPSRR